jgi:hypothetical protein
MLKMHTTLTLNMHTYISCMHSKHRKYLATSSWNRLHQENILVYAIIIICPPVGLLLIQDILLVRSRGEIAD